MGMKQYVLRCSFGPKIERMLTENQIANFHTLGLG